MLRTFSGLVQETKTNIRGGQGAATSATYLELGDMDGVIAAGRTRLEPGASIGEHPHPNTDELYLIVEGRGTGVMNGASFPVGPGDLFLTKAGQSHGLINDSQAPLTFFAVLTRQTQHEPPA